MHLFCESKAEKTCLKQQKALSSEHTSFKKHNVLSLLFHVFAIFMLIYPPLKGYFYLICYNLAICFSVPHKNHYSWHRKESLVNPRLT